MPYRQDGRDMFILRDPQAVADGALVVTREVLFLMSLMDGTRSFLDLQEAFMRAFGRPAATEELEAVVNAIDAQFLLQNERFECRLKEVMDEYEAAISRPAFLAGKSYPGGMQELASFLETMLDKGRSASVSGTVRGLLVPHIDYQRGLAVYRDTYPYLSGIEAPLIVIFGTCHHHTPKLWNISFKDFETPLGTCRNCRDISGMIKDHPFLGSYISEWPHRSEHSIELQLPLIQFLMAGRDYEILPILTGSMHEYVEGERAMDDDELNRLVSDLRRVLDQCGRPWCVIAGADLAHIGLQFGDAGVDPSFLASSRKKDQELLEQIRRVDRERFFSAVRDERDSRRICGLAPIYFQLALLSETRGEIISYDQWSDGASSVSFAGVVFYDKG